MLGTYLDGCSFLKIVDTIAIFSLLFISFLASDCTGSHWSEAHYSCVDLPWTMWPIVKVFSNVLLCELCSLQQLLFWTCTEGVTVLHGSPAKGLRS